MPLKSLLFPFSVLFGLVTQIRNTLYDRGIKPSVAFDLPVIAVGNLTVGGTGKSPLVEHIVRLLNPARRVATLSRGYGRKTKGFRLAGSDDTPETIGDEPYQFYRKFRNQLTVAVGEERALAIPLILQQHPETDVIILDDAFQHRKVKPSLNILLCDYTRPFYKDLLLPAGLLRESKHNARRADMIVVTKCPVDLTDDSMMEVQKELNILISKPIFFSTISYSSPVPFEHTHASLTNTFILVTGIGNAVPLVNHIKSHYSLVRHIEFGDHHEYTRRDLEKILVEAKRFPDASVLTTEKDMVKLENDQFLTFRQQIPFFYMPITVQFLKEGMDFDEMILNHVTSGV